MGGVSEKMRRGKERRSEREKEEERRRTDSKIAMEMS